MGLDHTEAQSFRYGKAVRAPLEIVTADALHHFPVLVRALGGDPDRLLRLARIDPSMLSDDRSVIEYPSFLEVLNLAAEKLGCPDFGLRLAAMRQGQTGNGLLGIAMHNSKTLGDALDFLASHAHVFSPATRLRLEPADRRKVFYHFEILPNHIRDKRQAYEHGLCQISLSVRELTGDGARARAVLFASGPLSMLSVYRDCFGCDVHFNQNTNAIVLDDQDLVCPTINPHALVYDMAKSFIETRYPRPSLPFSSRVRKLIQQNLGTRNCTNDRIAAELCVHPRTLLRRLRAEGASFEGIKDDVRRDIALRYLRDDVPLIRIAEKLGYAETSVLSRSCYRWFSMTPGQVRAKLRPGRTADCAAPELRLPDSPRS